MKTSSVTCIATIIFLMLIFLAFDMGALRNDSITSILIFIFWQTPHFFDFAKSCKHLFVFFINLSLAGICLLSSGQGRGMTRVYPEQADPC